MKILTASEMGEVDRLSTDIYHIPSILLMENAGRGVVEELERAYPGSYGKRITVVCGKGNNGGDGFVAARYLALRGGKPEILLFAEPGQLKGDALVNWEIARALDLPIHIFPTPLDARKLLKSYPPANIIVDALFGTGLSKPVGSEYKPIIDWINKAGSNSIVVAVDMPSGLFANSSEVPGIAVKAHLTVTFTALKLSQVLPPASDHAGRVIVLPIGSPPSLLENPAYKLEMLDAAKARESLHARARDSHKGSFGHLFVVAGSRGKSGAALMTGLAALRSGAGLVTLWLPKSLQADVVGKVPELMTESLPETRAGSPDVSGAGAVLDGLQSADALVIGPGVTTESSTRELVRDLVRKSTVPVVIDADGINAFASNPAELKNQRGQAIIITPHPGEMARLLGSSIPEIQRNRLETARKCATERGWITVLKGFQTIVAAPDGRVLINSSGNPGMATGGSGDILAGMIGCFAAVWRCRHSTAEAGALVDRVGAAVYLHGLAGDLAASEKGMESMIATDMIPLLSEAFKNLARRQ